MCSVSGKILSREKPNEEPVLRTWFLPWVLGYALWDTDSTGCLHRWEVYALLHLQNIYEACVYIYIHIYMPFMRSNVIYFKLCKEISNAICSTKIKFGETECFCLVPRNSVVRFAQMVTFSQFYILQILRFWVDVYLYDLVLVSEHFSYLSIQNDSMSVHVVTNFAVFWKSLAYRIYDYILFY